MIIIIYCYIYICTLSVSYITIYNWLKWDVWQAHTNWNARRIALIICCFFSCNQKMFKHVGLYLCFIDYSVIDSLIFNPLKYKVGITTLKCLLVVRFVSEFCLPSPMVLLGKEGHGNIIFWVLIPQPACIQPGLISPILASLIWWWHDYTPFGAKHVNLLSVWTQDTLLFFADFVSVMFETHIPRMNHPPKWYLYI